MKKTKMDQARENFAAIVRRQKSAEFCTIDGRGMYGRTVRVEAYGNVLERCGGAGYDKDSAALAGALSCLGRTDDERHSIACTGGAGERSVTAALRSVGYELVQHASASGVTAWTVRELHAIDGSALS